MPAGLIQFEVRLAHDKDQSIEQIIGNLKEHEIADPCRKHGVSDDSIYKWKAGFGGLEASEAKRLKTLEDENTRLKRLLDDAIAG